MNKKELVFAVLAIIGFVVCLSFVLAIPVMFLWNFAMPDIFGLPRIDYWHALAITLLTGILLGPRNAQFNKN